MLLWLSEWLISFNPHFNLLSYLSVRTISSSLVALVLTILLIPLFVRLLNKYRLQQTIRNLGPKTHLSKQGTPTMGGIVIVSVVSVSSLLFADLNNHYIQLALFTLCSFAIIGFLDDWLKIYHSNTKGLSARYKYLLQSIVALCISAYLYVLPEHQNILMIPVIKDVYIPLGLFYILLTYFVIVGSSNAVNLTDGLDGLAILPIAVIAGALGGLSYINGHSVFSEYLHLPHLAGSGELIVLCGALVGASLGFLWFNSYPALLFMGDVGALSLGAVLGVIAVLVHHEILFFITSGVFVAEALSVILQVGSFKLRGKRIFKMAPLHHHYELKGWPETKVITRFWIITIVLVLFALACLKIR